MKQRRYLPVCAYETGTFHILKWADTEAKYFPKARGMMYQRKYLLGSSILGTPHARSSGGRKMTMEKMWKSDTVTGIREAVEDDLVDHVPPGAHGVPAHAQEDYADPFSDRGALHRRHLPPRLLRLFGGKIAKVRRGARRASLPLVWLQHGSDLAHGSPCFSCDTHRIGLMYVFFYDYNEYVYPMNTKPNTMFHYLWPPTTDMGKQ